MERKTIGGFIAALRRATGMTQKELAEKLNVSDKTVSRWERENRTPQIAMKGKFYSFCLRNGFEIDTTQEGGAL